MPKDLKKNCLLTKIGPYTLKDSIACEKNFIWAVKKIQIRKKKEIFDTQIRSDRMKLFH